MSGIRFLGMSGLCKTQPMAEKLTDYERIAELAYQEAVRGISKQGASLDELRTRTGALLSAVILATSFLGAFAAKNHGHGLLPRFYGPVILFGVATIFCVFILLPYPGWFLALDAKDLLASIDKANPPGIVQIYTDAVDVLAEARRRNQLRLGFMLSFFGAAAFVAVAEIIWWIIEVV